MIIKLQNALPCITSFWLSTIMKWKSLPTDNNLRKHPIFTVKRNNGNTFGHSLSITKTIEHKYSQLRSSPYKMVMA